MAGQGVVIANTTPLINFAQIGRLELLRQLFGEVVIPPAIVDELSDKQRLFPLVADVVSASLTRVEVPANVAVVTTLTQNIHLGEAEHSALALEQSGNVLVILDDLAARQAARHHQLLFTGTIGCLTLAKNRGLIAEIAPLLDDLRRLARFWQTDDLVQSILTTCGERA